MWGVVRLVFSEREGKRGMGWRRGMSQRHELVLCRRHQPARAQAVVPHHCPIFVGPTRPDFAASSGRILKRGPQCPPLSLGAIVKQESMAPPLCYLTQSSRSRSSSSRRTVPTEVYPRGVRPRQGKGSIGKGSGCGCQRIYISPPL